MLADPVVGARRGTGRVGVMDLASSRSLSLAFVLSPRALSALCGGRCELCALPHPRFLTTGGAEFRRLFRSLGLEDELDEFSNGCDRVESGSVVRDGVGIALL